MAKLPDFRCIAVDRPCSGVADPVQSHVCAEVPRLVDTTDRGAWLPTDGAGSWRVSSGRRWVAPQERQPQTSHPASTFDGVPRISAFYGIIAMYFDDHPPPHFHAKYGEYQAQVAIATGEVLNGELPRRARALVEEWAELHRDELMTGWDLAARQEPLNRIEPCHDRSV